MKIKLDDKYYIEVKAIGSFELRVNKVSENGVERDEFIGDHRTLEHALKNYIHVNLANQELEVSINEFIELHKELLEKTERIARGQYEGV